MYGNRLIAFDRDNNEKLSEDFWSLVVIRTVTIVIAYVAFIVYLVFVGEYRNEYLYQSIQIVAVIFDISWLFWVWKILNVRYYEAVSLNFFQQLLFLFSLGILLVLGYIS